VIRISDHRGCFAERIVSENFKTLIFRSKMADGNNCVVEDFESLENLFRVRVI
jgi:hypothetical protein